MSLWQFNIYIAGVVGEVYERTHGTGDEVIHKTWRACLLSQVLFIDDTALVTKSSEQLQRLVTEIRRICGRKKLSENGKKQGWWFFRFFFQEKAKNQFFPYKIGKTIFFSVFIGFTWFFSWFQLVFIGFIMFPIYINFLLINRHNTRMSRLVVKYYENSVS